MRSVLSQRNDERQGGLKNTLRPPKTTQEPEVALRRWTHLGPCNPRPQIKEFQHHP